jgi:hypothetical protein
MTDPIPAAARAANLRLWNAWTRVHEKSAFYDVEGFKAGATSLWPLEHRLLPAPEQPDVEPVGGSYADRSPDTAGLVAYGWAHSFAEILDPLLRSGLRLEFLHEFPHTIVGLPFPFLEVCEDGLQRVEGHHEDFPLSFSLKMTKEG